MTDQLELHSHQVIKYNQSGSLKKIQTNKTEDNKLYMKEYMRLYIKSQEPIICEECGCKFKEYQKYRHVKTKLHMKIVDKLSKLLVKA